MHLPLANIHTFYTAYQESDALGKLIFLGLFASSIISWCVLVHKVWLIRKVKKLSESFRRSFQRHNGSLLQLNLSDVQTSGLREVTHPLREVFSSLQTKTLELLRKNHFFSSANNHNSAFLSPPDLELIESHVLTTVSSQIKHLEKNLFVLTTIITLGPFLGLLGTVWGILITFSGLQGGASISSNTAVLSGLSTALTTTVLGLMIAIPALIGYNYLKNSVKNIASELEDFLYNSLSQIELEYRKVDKE